MRAGQQEDVPGDLDIYGDVLPRPHVYQPPSRAGLDDPVAREQSDRAQTGLVGFNFLKIIQSMDRSDLTEILINITHYIAAC